MPSSVTISSSWVSAFKKLWSSHLHLPSTCIMAELWRPKGLLREPHTHIGKKRKPTSWFSHGYHGQRYCPWVPTHDGDNDGNGVTQHGGHTPNNRLTETCSLGLPCTSLILDIHVMINWHLSKQGIHWPVSCDHIVGSSLQLIKVTCLLEINRWPGAGFRLDRGLMLS